MQSTRGKAETLEELSVTEVTDKMTDEEDGRVYARKVAVKAPVESSYCKDETYYKDLY